jgi:hypothetical protein
LEDEGKAAAQAGGFEARIDVGEAAAVIDAVGGTDEFFAFAEEEAFFGEEPFGIAELDGIVVGFDLTEIGIDGEAALTEGRSRTPTSRPAEK